MKRRKLILTIQILLSAGVLFLCLLGYLNYAIFQLKQDKLYSDSDQVESEIFFAVKYNFEDLQLFVDQIRKDPDNLPEIDGVQKRLRVIFINYSSAGDTVQSSLARKGIPANVKWTISVPRFEVRLNQSVIPFVFARDNPKEELVLFGDPDISPEAKQYRFYKIGEDHYCQINLYIEISNRFAILRSQMLPIFSIDLVLLLLFGGAIAYTIKVLFQQKKLVELQSDYINGINHEFNTPLSSIQLAGQTLLKLNEDQVIERKDEIASLILRQQSHLKKMVDQVLAASVLENPFVSKDFEWFPAPEVFINMVVEWQQAHSGIQIYFLPDSSERRWIKIDPNLFTIVVHNILDNAEKYTQSSQPEIKISQTIHSDQYTIRIADNGIGIPPGEKDSVFEKFRRGSSASRVKAKGLGLGLYLVRRIVELHHGRVGITSKVGLGTEISMTLPSKNERAI